MNFNMMGYQVKIMGDIFIATKDGEAITGEYTSKLSLMNTLKHNKENIYLLARDNKTVAYSLKGKKMRYGIGEDKELALNALQEQYECNCSQGNNLGCVSTDELNKLDIIDYLKSKNLF